MTSLNLATIFGPNLLHKLKTSDKEFVVESLARVEESTAIISLVQRMIDTYDTLFMVPADVQDEVLKSLLETDADVVDYLLRRKASQNSPEEHLCLSGRCLSHGSIKASSGEVSPYDNNSPVFSNHPMQYPGDSSSLSSKPRDHSSGNSSPTLSMDKGSNDPFWDDWHELFNRDFRGHHPVTGSAGDTSECESYGSSEGLNSHQGNNKLPVTTTIKTLLGGQEFKPHLPVTRSSSGPQDWRGQRHSESLLHQGKSDQSGALSSENLAERTGHSAGPFFKVRTDGHSPLYHCALLRETHISHSTPSLVKYQPQGLDFQSQQLSQQSTDSQTLPTAHLPDPGNGVDPNAHEWDSERWHMWNILSTENADALPETLV